MKLIDLGKEPDQGPPGMTWEEYEAFLWEAWPRVLTEHANDEKKVHAFLAQHPCLLPGGEAGSRSMNKIGGHHGPFPGAVVFEPPLPGTFTRQPDFMWPTKQSGTFKPVLIELEAPGKRWFRKDGQQDEKVTQAVNQVAEWRTWFDDQAHQLLFYKLYGISEWIRAYHKVEPVYQLIYGRRSDYINDPRLTKHRESLRPGWLHWSSYDRLFPDYHARNWVTVRIVKEQWTVVAVPPTFHPSHWSESNLQGLEGIDEAIDANELIPPERKAFLHDHIASLDLKPKAPPELWETVLREGRC